MKYYKFLKFKIKRIYHKIKKNNKTNNKNGKVK